MSSLQLDANAQALTAFLLVLARTTTWSVTCPILSAKQPSSIARLVFGVALAAFLTPLVSHQHIPTDLAGFVSAIVIQILIGLALGWITGLLLTAVEMAGNLADYVSGFSYGAQIDPITGAQSAAFQRLSNMTMLALLFATGGASVIVEGFARSFDVYSITSVPHLANGAAAGLGHLLTRAVISALEIGAPLLGAVFLTDVGLALVAKFVPQANILNVGLSLKALVAFSSLGAVLTLLPGELSGILDDAISSPGVAVTAGAHR